LVFWFFGFLVFLVFWFFWFFGFFSLLLQSLLIRGTSVILADVRIYEKRGAYLNITHTNRSTAETTMTLSYSFLLVFDMCTMDINHSLHSGFHGSCECLQLLLWMIVPMIHYSLSYFLLIVRKMPPFAIGA